MGKKNRSRREDEDEDFKDNKQNRRDKRSNRRAIKNTLQVDYRVVSDDRDYEEFDTDGLEQFEDY